MPSAASSLVVLLLPFQARAPEGCSGMREGCADLFLLLGSWAMRLWSSPREGKAVLSTRLRFGADALEAEEGLGMEEPLTAKTGTRALGTKGLSCSFRRLWTFSQTGNSGRLKAAGLAAPGEPLSSQISKVTFRSRTGRAGRG